MRPTERRLERAFGMPAIWIGCLVLWSGASACFARGPVGVTEVGPGPVYESITACALNGDTLSSVTREVLQFFDLQGLHDEDRLAALRALHERAVAEPRPPILFALAELSYLAGRKRADPDCYLAAAVYSYYFLFGQEKPEPANPYDRRFRWACDLYNGGLMRAFASSDGKQFTPDAEQRALPTGTLRVSFDRQHLPTKQVEGRAAPLEIVDFLPADRFLTRGLSLRLRDSGLGVPLIGLFDRKAAAAADDSLLQFGSNEMPATAFLRLGGSLAELEGGIDAVVELYSGFESPSVEVNGELVPLETDRSATLAHALDRAEVWQFDVRGFFSSELATRANKLILVQPYQPDRVPVIFVHGTGSNPAYWADLFNSLWWDPEIRQRVQFWFFRYTTGNPVGYSAAALRDALNQAVAHLDPEGKDAALRDMIIVGHSQGGLLAKLMVVDGSIEWLEQVVGAPVADLDLDPAQEALVRRVFEFEPVPSVKRVVFVSTPHRGSFLATRWFSRILAQLIQLPKDVTDIGAKLLTRSQRLPAELRGRMPTSLANMDPGNPYLNYLQNLPVAPGVVCHSIISIGSADPNDPEDWADADDGVVEYSSAHQDYTASECLVPSGHSCQSHPVTIQEVRRILLEHLHSTP